LHLRPIKIVFRNKGRGDSTKSEESSSQKPIVGGIQTVSKEKHFGKRSDDSKDRERPLIIGKKERNQAECAAAQG